jgi:hypothetical protein
MNWFQQNRFLGSFLGACALATLLAGYFLIHEKAAADDQETRLETTINDLTRLRRSSPFPNEENLKKTKAQTDIYRSSLLALENELKTRTLPILPIQPNEFQAQLRQSVNAVIETARASKVQLPGNFYLGFDEYATSLPNSAAAPLLGRELKAIEALANAIVGAHVDALNSLTRAPLMEEKAAPVVTPAKARGSKSPLADIAAPGIVEGNSVEFSFSASPTATRKVLNRIASAREELLVIRTLVVKNQVDKGPKRESVPEEATAPAAHPPGAIPAGAKTPAGPGVSFIVGTEHLSVSAKIEIVSLNFPPEESR